VRDIEALLVDLERAEMRLACWALSDAFGALDLHGDGDGTYYAQPCACGHACDDHVVCVGRCDSCACRAFVARTSPSDSDSGAAVASLNTTTEAT
jgi:hypothetical protein